MIRKDILESLQAYVDHGRPPGGFLRSVLCNYFVQACLSADEENRKTLPEIASHIWNNLPGDCWGSPEAVNKWLLSFHADKEGDNASERP